MIILYLAILGIGFYALIRGADLFVEGSAALARNLKVPALIIGLTVVAMGTSAPELAVSSLAAIQGSNEIALSNVVGSNIANLLVVLGVCAAVHPVPVQPAVLKRDFPVSVVSTVFVLLSAGGVALFGGSLPRTALHETVGTVTRWMAAVLLAGFVIYLVVLIVLAKKHPLEEEEEGPRLPGRRCGILIAVGLALIIGGGQGVVYSARKIAAMLGMTETLIGLTVVAIGTSLPELVTSLVAARKGETELALGNAVGSNLFNMMLILGVSAIIHPVEVNAASVWDLLILLAVSGLTWAFAATGRKIVRSEALCMVALYVATVVFAVLR